MLNKFLRALGLSFILFASVFFVSPQTASAACSCTVTDASGACGTSCDPITKICKATCTNGSSTRSVSGTQSGSTCTYYSNSSACNILSNGSCNLTVGSTPGSCTISTPAPSVPPGSTPPPASCSGSCFTGINNCGEVGRQSASGSCSSGLCCGFGGGVSGPYCGNYSQYCGYSTGGSCNASGPNGPPYVCIFCPATKPNDNWVPMGSFQYPNCTNDVCANQGKPSTPVWIGSTPHGIDNGATISPGLYYFSWTSPGANVATRYAFQIDDTSVGAPNSWDWNNVVTQGEIWYGNPRYWTYTFKANTDYKIAIVHYSDSFPGCNSVPLIMSFTTKVGAPPAPTLTLTASPTSVPTNGSSTLTWSSTNATTCTATGDWTGSRAVNGSLVETVTSNDTYTLTCTGAGGSVTKSVSVTVTASAPTLTLTASPTSVPSNGSSTLSWSSTNTTSCTASGSWTGAKTVNGSQAQTAITANKTYTLTCTGPGGNISKTANVSVIGSPALPTVNLTASPTTVPSAGSTTLTWSTTNATSCTASNGWSGAKTISGSQVITNNITNKTFVLTCTGPGGSSNDSATLTVSVAPVVPTLTLTASPTSVPSNGSSTLTWSSTNATACTASGSWSGAKTVSGSQSQTAITTNKTYTLTCTGSGGSVSKTANVNVIGSPALPTVNLTASPTSVPSAGSTTLNWSTTNATSCTASNGWSGAKTTSGSQVITNNISNKTFVLTCTGPGGSSNDSATLTVTVSATAPTVTLTANPTTVPSAGSTTLTWSSTNATSCTASNGWTGSKTLSGSQVIANNLSNKIFTLACTGAGGTTSRSASITILAAPVPTVNLTASPSSLVGPGNVTLRWTTTNATSCTASNGWSGAKVLNGSQVDPTVSASKTYSLRCTNASGSTTDTATVTYTAPTCGLPAPRDPAPPVCAPNPPTQNGSITWTWPAVPGADRYSFDVVDATTGASVGGYATGMVNGQTNFNCRPNQATPDICSKTTTLPPGSYRSRVSAGSSTNSCLVSPIVSYPPVGQPGKDIVLCPAVPWWQSGSGSVFSQGNIQSTIPASCTPPTCINTLIQNGNSSVPGIALGGTSSAISTGTGSISSTRWVAQSSISGRVPDYDSFVGLIPVSITPTDPGATVAGGAFNSGGATTGDGYSWYRHNGNVTITADLNLSAGRKVILFVDGNLTINGKISYSPTDAFFMPIVKGNTVIDPAVTSAAGTPTLTGIFYSGGSFSTGAGTGPLSVLGSVVSMGGINMERDLGAGNNFESAEKFTISPELMLNYPGTLSFKRPIWREVAP